MIFRHIPGLNKQFDVRTISNICRKYKIQNIDPPTQRIIAVSNFLQQHSNTIGTGFKNRKNRYPRREISI